MNSLRQAAQQALEALEIGYDSAKAEADQFHSAMAGYKPQRHAQMDADVQTIAKAITALRAALAEQEPVARLKRGTTGRCTRRVCECEKEGLGLECIWLEPMIDGYPLWSGIPTAKQQEPVAWQINDGTSTYVTDRRVDAEEAAAEGWVRTPLYTAPTPRKPLTDEGIDELSRSMVRGEKSVNWLCRAIERAHGIKE